MAVSCALEGPGMGLAAPHCHPAPPEAQGNSWGCLGPAVAMLVAIQRPKRAKSVPRQKGPKPCKSTLGGSRGMKPPQPMAQITQRDPWGVCELHRTTGRTSNKPHNPIVKTPSRNSRLITRPPMVLQDLSHQAEMQPQGCFLQDYKLQGCQLCLLELARRPQHTSQT